MKTLTIEELHADERLYSLVSWMTCNSEDPNQHRMNEIDLSGEGITLWEQLALRLNGVFPRHCTLNVGVFDLTDEELRNAESLVIESIDPIYDSAVEFANKEHPAHLSQSYIHDPDTNQFTLMNEYQRVLINLMYLSDIDDGWGQDFQYDWTFMTEADEALRLSKYNQLITGMHVL